MKVPVPAVVLGGVATLELLRYTSTVVVVAPLQFNLALWTPLVLKPLAVSVKLLAGGGGEYITVTVNEQFAVWPSPDAALAATVAPGYTDAYNAAAPVTCGVAIDLPLKEL